MRTTKRCEMPFCEKMKSDMKKGNVSAVRSVALLLTLLLLCTVFCGCLRQPAPDLQDVRDELIALIEASGEVNRILFGTGLPVYAPDSEEARILGLYHGNSDAPEAFVVRFDAQCASCDDIRALAKSVYADIYIDPVLDGMLQGRLITTPEGKQTLLHADYNDAAIGLTMASDRKVFVTDTRTYLYDTMKITKKSTGTVLYVSVDSFLPSSDNDGDPEIMNVTLSFVKNAEGAWRLNTPTY